jgi:hypothetical protein
MAKKKDNKTIFVTILAVIIAVGFLGPTLPWIANLGARPAAPSNPSNESNPEPQANVPCIDPKLPIPEEYHIHPHLAIIINGTSTPIPANIGLDLQCNRVIHTHDQSGEIHIEPNTSSTFTLGDFFSVWGVVFNPYRIGDFTTDAEHEIIMTVNGKPSEEFENLVPQDKQEIVIEYRRVVSRE